MCSAFICVRDGTGVPVGACIIIHAQRNKGSQCAQCILLHVLRLLLMLLLDDEPSADHMRVRTAHMRRVIRSTGGHSLSHSCSLL